MMYSFLTKVLTSNVDMIVRAFVDYGKFSREEDNWNKYFVYLGNLMPLAKRTIIADGLQVLVSGFPLSYLEVPLFHGYPSIKHLLPLADKILYHFFSWQGKTHSLVGRVCLVNSIISSMFIHSFAI